MFARNWQKLAGLLRKENGAAISVVQQYIEALQQRYRGGKRLEPAGYKVYSMSDEDGIIAEIFRRIGTTNRKFVEFGCGNGTENNSAYLLLQGWSGLWLDSQEEIESQLKAQWPKEAATRQIRFIRTRVTANNINQLLVSNEIEGVIDFLSIDIDSNDYYVWDAITAIQPRVLCIEYNAKFRPPVEWIMPRNDDYSWDGSDRMGASLSALEKLGLRKGYSLVGCNITGSNAFFVRNELVSNQFDEPFTAENHYQPPRYFLNSGFYSGHPSITVR